MKKTLTLALVLALALAVSPLATALADEGHGEDKPTFKSHHKDSMFGIGEGMCGPKHEEMLRLLAAQPVETVTPDKLVMSRTDARQVARQLHGKVDCLLAVITTFVPDHFIVELLDQCDVP